MAKKKTKKESPRGVKEKSDEECVALIRDFFNRNDVDFCENDDNGVHLFSVEIGTEEGVVSFSRGEIAVGSTEVKTRCEMPLRVPKSRLAEALTFVNHMNSENLGCGTLVVDPEDNRVAILNVCYVSVIKRDVNSAMGDLFGSMMSLASVCGDNILEIITGGALPESQDEDKEESSTKEADENTTPAEKTKREPRGPMAPTALTPDYSLDGLDIQSEVPLEQLVAAVTRFRKTHRSSEVVPRLSILLSGPSGCGKSEFVKYLGKRAGMEVVVVTASNVLRALVGETEQRIADVFKEATEKKAILFLDEVDSLLYDRKKAFYGWERVQTNELLLQMERFTGVLVCATNLVEQLDSAVMRRFTFKVRMGALDDDGKVKFFTRYFKTALTTAERRRLVSIPNLTPGDFRTVRERLYFLGKKRGSGNAHLLSALEVESAVKKESRAPIGFVR